MTQDYEPIKEPEWIAECGLLIDAYAHQKISALAHGDYDDVWGTHAAGAVVALADALVRTAFDNCPAACDDWRGDTPEARQELRAKITSLVFGHMDDLE